MRERGCVRVAWRAGLVRARAAAVRERGGMGVAPMHRRGGDHAMPVEEVSSTPVEEESATPAEEESATPVEEESATPAEEE